MGLIEIVLGPLADGRFWVSILPMLPVAGLLGLLAGRTVSDRDRGRVTVQIMVFGIVVWAGSQYLKFLGETDSAVGEFANLIQGDGWALSALLASSWWMLTVWGVDRMRAGRPTGPPASRKRRRERSRPVRNDACWDSFVVTADFQGRWPWPGKASLAGC